MIQYFKGVGSHMQTDSFVFYNIKHDQTPYVSDIPQLTICGGLDILTKVFKLIRDIGKMKLI